MKAIFYSLLFVASMIAAEECFSQKKLDTNDEIKLDKSFQISGKSRTMQMKKGDTYDITLDLKKDRAYYISVSGNKSLNNIQYKLVSETEVTEVLYDNAAYEFNNQAIVSVKEDSRVILKVKTQPANYLAYSTDKKEVKLLIASKKVKNASSGKIPYMVVLASNN
jgi:hypothetical protein